MSVTVDNLIAARIIYLLVLPFNKWDAFKEGIIDADGNRTGKIADMSDNWTMLHRLVARLKKMLAALPAGKSLLASVAAAYLLIRECVEKDIEPELLEDYFQEAVEFSEPMTMKTYQFVSETLDQISEDGGVGATPANTVGTGQIAGAAPGEQPPVRLKKKVMKRNALPTIPKES